ncbi:tropinone reductase homolog At2g29150-like [Brassica rapa]|uniref:tropinone reductase homolog At2g29150-like n=1 Tax=Brassica campestris TaxID=3711 RepID=UPI0004F1841B|nr:tropinone reductase homolog At2g29150-like [Brassica rapa]
MESSRHERSCHRRNQRSRELASLGARIQTCARDESQLNQCLQEWKMKGFNVTGSVCDISSRADREKLMQTVSSLFDENLNRLVLNECDGIVQFILGEEFSKNIAPNTPMRRAGEPEVAAVAVFILGEEFSKNI